MGSTASALSARLYTLTVFLFILTFVGHVSAQSDGMQASVDNYILPQYREKDNRLDYVIFGAKAENRGALLSLQKVKVDILNNEGKGIYDLKDANIYRTTSAGETVPDAYDIESTIKARRDFSAGLLKSGPRGKIIRNTDAERKLLKIRNEFWKKNPKQKHVNAWVYADAGTYDKNTRILRSENNVPAYFRSRDIDVDGIGFDAYSRKRFIHIRSNVRIIYHNYVKDGTPGKEDGINFIAVSDNMDIDNSNKKSAVFTLHKNVKVENIEDKNVKMKITLGKNKTVEVDAVAITQISCDKMVIYTNPSQSSKDGKKNKDEASRLDKIEFFDNIVITRKEIPVDPQYAAHVKTQTVRCQYLVYNMAELKATLRGQPVLTSDRNRIVGDMIEIYLKKSAEKADKGSKKIKTKLDPYKYKITLPKITFYNDSDVNQAPFQVEANVMEYDADKDRCFLYGNVIGEQLQTEEKHVTDSRKCKLQTHTRISCNKMVILLADKPKTPGEKKTAKPNDNRISGGKKQLKQLECFDDVVITRKAVPQDLDKHPEFRKFVKDEASESDYAVFNNNTRRLLLSGRPIVTSNKDILKGKTIELLFEKAVAGAQQDGLKLQNVRVNLPDLTYYGDTQLAAGQKQSAVDGDAQPHRVTARLMDYNVKSDICELRYEVWIRQTAFDQINVKDAGDETKTARVKTQVDMDLRCEKMFIHLKNAPKTAAKANKEDSGKELKKIECFRDVVITRKSVPLDARYQAHSELQSSTSDYAEFNSETQMLMLKDKPVLVNGLSRLQGERMEIQLAKNAVAGNSAKSKMEFNPENVKVYMPILHYYADSTEAGKNKKPVFAESNVLHYDTKKDLCTLLGNVVVDDAENARITCDKMMIYLENAPEKAVAGTTETVSSADKKAAQSKQLKLLECFGEVNIVHRASVKDSTAKDRVSVSDYAVYDPKKMIMTLSGNPVFNSGGDKMSGERIDIYFMEDEERALQAVSAGSMRRKLMIRNMKVSMPVVNYNGDTKMPGK